MKITPFNGDVENISKLSDRPNIESGYTAQMLKEMFDKAGVDIKDYINNVLIKELETNQTGSSGADRVGSGYIENVSGNTVQDKLKSLANRINEVVSTNVPDGSLTASKFTSEIAQFLLSASCRERLYLKPGDYQFEIPRTGIYKITAVGGGAGGGVVKDDVSRRLGGGGGGTSIYWSTMYKGDTCLIKVGKGGKGLTVDGTTLVSHAEDGEESSVDICGSIEVLAPGGKFGHKTEAPECAGSIKHNGGYPRMSDYSGGDAQFAIGGDSVYGNGGAFEGDIAGVGGGGYAGKHLGSGTYSQGYDGGDGFVLLEYLS